MFLNAVVPGVSVVICMFLLLRFLAWVNVANLKSELTSKMI